MKTMIVDLLENLAFESGDGGTSVNKEAINLTAEKIISIVVGEIYKMPGFITDGRQFTNQISRLELITSLTQDNDKLR